METIWLWVWYIVTLIVAWFLLWFAGVPGGVGFVIATIIALIVGLILLPNYNKPNLSEEDEKSITGFIIVIVLLPILGLIFAFAAGSHHNYWDRGMKNFNEGSCFVETDAVCTPSGDCFPARTSKSCPEGKTTLHFPIS